MLGVCVCVCVCTAAPHVRTHELVNEASLQAVWFEVAGVMQIQVAEVSGSSCIVLPSRTTLTVVRFDPNDQHVDKMHISVYGKLAIGKS